ncbi:MAG: Hsp20/alpha crystallin family protein [Thermodesulfobacteriota bacterium]
MAKISKKPPGSPPTELDNLNCLLFEGIEEAGFFSHPEPITQIPNVDVFSTRNELVIEVELPGVKKQDIDVTLLKGTLTIKAVKLECFDEDKINYVCMERTFGRLFRAIEIPFPVDTVRIKAVFRNGILTITIPRIEDKRNTSRRVPVEGA